MNRFDAPDLKVPSLVKDLMADLRDRRLLPLVVLLVVAIIAVPLLLADGSSPPAPARLPRSDSQVPTEARLNRRPQRSPASVYRASALAIARRRILSKQQYNRPGLQSWVRTDRTGDDLEQQANSSSADVGSTPRRRSLSPEKTASSVSSEGSESAVPQHVKQTPSVSTFGNRKRHELRTHPSLPSRSTRSSSRPLSSEDGKPESENLDPGKV